jgi:hypothetical protein
MALSEDGCLQQLSLKCNIDKQIKDIMSTMTSFGSVSIETSPPSVVIKTMKAKQAQIFQSTNIILPFEQTMHPAIHIGVSLFFPFGISNVLCKVSLISLIDFTDYYGVK